MAVLVVSCHIPSLWGVPWVEWGKSAEGSVLRTCPASSQPGCRLLLAASSRVASNLVASSQIALGHFGERAGCVPELSASGSGFLPSSPTLWQESIDGQSCKQQAGIYCHCNTVTI